MAELTEDFYKQIEEQDREVEVALADYSGILTSNLEDVGEDVSKFEPYIPIVTSVFFGALTAIMLDRSEKVAKLSAEYDLPTTQSFITQTMGKSASIIFTQDVVNYPAQVKDRVLDRINPVDNRTLRQRMKWVKDGTTKTVQNIVANGVRDHKTNDQIAKAIESYIRPEAVKGYVSPWSVAKQRFNYTKGTVADIPKGSVSYQAHLIARTEANYTLRQSQVDMYGEQDWCLGFDWKLSTRHKIYDICDLWAAGSPYTVEDLPYDHANGLCGQIRRLMNANEFNKWQETGKLPQVEYGNPKKIQKQYDLQGKQVPPGIS